MPPVEEPPTEQPSTDPSPSDDLPPCTDDHPAVPDLTDLPPCQDETPELEVPPADEPPAEMPPVEEPPTEQPSTDPSPSDDLPPCTDDHPAVPDLTDLPPCQDETPELEVPPADEPPAEMPPVEEPPTEQPSTDPSPSDDLPPCTDDHPAVPDLTDLPPCQDETPELEVPPADEPPAEMPPVEEPPTEQPSTEEPASQELVPEDPPAEQAPADQSGNPPSTDPALTDPNSSDASPPTTLPSLPGVQDPKEVPIFMTTRAGSGLTIDISNFVHEAGAITTMAQVAPTNGTLSVAGLVATYTPNPGFYGVDAFTLRVCDSSAVCLDLAASVTVPPVNDFLLTTGAALAEFFSGRSTPGLYDEANLLPDATQRIIVPLAGLAALVSASLWFGLDSVGSVSRRWLAMLAAKS